MLRHGQLFGWTGLQPADERPGVSFGVSLPSLGQIDDLKKEAAALQASRGGPGRPTAEQFSSGVAAFCVTRPSLLLMNCL
jgi:hypothetical protein